MLVEPPHRLSANSSADAERHRDANESGGHEGRAAENQGQMHVHRRWIVVGQKHQGKYCAKNCRSRIVEDSRLL